MNIEKAIHVLTASGLVAESRKEIILGGMSVEDMGDGIVSYAQLFRILQNEAGNWIAICMVSGQKPIAFESHNLSKTVQKVIEIYHDFGFLIQKSTAA